MKNWYVYIVECNDGSYYTGCTIDLIKRMKQHNKGTGSKYVKSAGGVRTGKFIEITTNRSEAQKLESRIKALSRQKKERLVNLDAMQKRKWLFHELSL